ncbi:hypothetical protein BC940DRAFT_338505 [Gongronella butleri]|nr:hypothetical protein BC940DRAFT_338505 [Gongronella butleri]
MHFRFYRAISNRQLPLERLSKHQEIKAKPSPGYGPTNVNLYCLTCNLFINAYDPDEAKALIDYIFGANDKEPKNHILTPTEATAISGHCFATYADPIFA